MKKKIRLSCFRLKGYLTILSIACFVLTNIPAQAQGTSEQVVIKGNVTDEFGEPIIGVIITSAADAKLGTVTNVDGNFELKVPGTKRTIVISYLGFESQTITPDGDAPLRIKLKEQTTELNTVVVVGYGTQKKETLTGSISVVDSKTLLKSPTANITNALVGRVPGIVSNQMSGEVGNDAATIRIRGMGTPNSEGVEPLIVIDGVEATISAMNMLDPNEIESISTLKDASTTAVYGIRGANGVIVVTTKRGETGKPSINFSYRFGLTQSATLLKPLNSYEYAMYRNEAIMSDNATSLYSYLFSDAELWKFRYNRDYTPEEVEMMNISAEQKDALLRSPATYYGSHDYIKDQFGGLAPQQQYNINISGGIDKMKYFVSLGYLDQKGNFQNAEYRGYDANSSYNRYNLRTNLDVNILKNTKISVDFGAQIADLKGIMGEGSNPTSDASRHKTMMVTILGNTPFVGPGIVDGNLVQSYVSGKSDLQSKGGYGYSPLTYLLTREMLNTQSSNLSTTAKIEHVMDYITQGLSIGGTVSYNDSYSKSLSSWNNVATYSMYLNPDNPNENVFVGGSEIPKSITDNRFTSKWRRVYLEARVKYNRTFNRHNVSALILANAQRTNDPGLQYQTPAGLMGTVGRLTYGYDNRYLAELSMGYNGSENFPENKRFGFFPALSVGWIITEESFIPRNNILTWLKIRASYGEVGNDKVSSNRYLYLEDSWGYFPDRIGNGYYFGYTDGTAKNPYYQGAYELRLGNPNVTWERARKTNIGLNANLFSDKLAIVGDIFLEKRNDILLQLGTVPGIVAASLPPANIGKVDNKGFELQVTWRDKILSDQLYYSIGFNVAYAINKQKYLDEPAYAYPWLGSTGFAIGQYKGLRTSSFYNNNTEASNRPYNSHDGNNVQPGDFRYIDIDGDGKIDDNDKTPIGYANLSRYTFGSNIDFEYKGFSLSLLFTGSAKGSLPISSGEYIINPFYMNNGAAFDFQYEGRWTPEKVQQGITPTFPRASMRTKDSQNGLMNDMWLQSTQHIRLKNAEIGYTIRNMEKLQSIGISSIRIFANGNNLITWGSDLPSGFDPEQQDSGGASSGYLYPLTRTYNLGINIQF